MKIGLRHFKVILLGVATGAAATAAIVTACSGCSSQQQHTSEAEGALAAQELDCVDKNPTRSTIDACRAKVRANWGIVSTVTDAGGQ